MNSICFIFKVKFNFFFEGLYFDCFGFPPCVVRLGKDGGFKYKCSFKHKCSIKSGSSKILIISRFCKTANGDGCFFKILFQLCIQNHLRNCLRC